MKTTEIQISQLQQEGPGLLSGLGNFCMEFAFSTCVCVGSLRVPRLPPTVQTQLLGLLVRLNCT